ncbi:MAG: outer membrane protein assembly factor BamD [Planctomycetes bacterium]|nr:outer membrane protein assembly factor BamD [Planctomycetota bacterium]
MSPCAALALVLASGWFHRAPERPAEDLLAGVRLRFEGGRHEAARRRADRLLAAWPDSPLAEEASFLAAEAAFFLDDYPDAYRRYEEHLQRYPDSGHSARAVEREHQIGSAYVHGTHERRFLWMRFSRAGEGLEVLERVVTRYPYEEFSDDDQFLVATYHYDRGDYLEARYAFQELLDRFPESEWAGIGRYRLALCILSESQGIEYDQTPIEEATQELRTYVSRFPGGNKAAEARGKLAEMAEVRAQERYRIARFYLREGRHRSASIYLASIVADYGGTRWAERARSELPEVERLAREGEESQRELPPLPGEAPAEAFPADAIRGWRD